MLKFDIDNYLSFSVHGGADSGGMAGSVNNILAFLESTLSLTPSQIFSELLPGISALANMHPLFVHFPITLLSLFFIVDTVASLADRSEWRKLASWFLYLGALFAGMTVAAGLIAANAVAHGGDVHEIMEHHEHLGISVFSLALVLSVWRLLAKDSLTGSANVLHLLLAGLLSILLIFTADLGGLMVYRYGVAVLPVAASNQEAANAHQHNGDIGDPHQPQPKPVEDNRATVIAPVGEPAPSQPVQEPNVGDHLTPPHLHSHSDGTKHQHKHAH